MKSLYCIVVVLGFMFLFSCDEQSTNNNTIIPKDTINKVLPENNGWKSIAQFSTENISPNGYMSYQITDCGISLDNNDNLNFILKLEKQATPNSFNTYYLVNLSESQNTKTVKIKTDGWYDWKKYYFKPKSTDLLEAWYYNKIIGTNYFYENTHPLVNSYNNGSPTLDENGNVLTYGTLTGTGSSIYNFVRYAGSQSDSLFINGSQSYITSGFYSSILKNKNTYQISKALKKIWVSKNSAVDYNKNSYGILDLFQSITVNNMQDELTTNFIAETSQDKRYIYYWVIESYESPSRCWFFKFDVESETLTKVLDNVPLVKSIFADQTGKSKLATIADDGTLFIAGNDNPNASKPIAKIYKVSPNDGVVSEYKSTNLLKADKYGNNYQISYIKFLNGKLYFTVQSGLLKNDRPQLDIITEE